MVARLMAAGRDHLGLRRQVFFVGTGGYDSHDGLGTKHPLLLRSLDESLTSFHDAVDLMGARDQVTSFTASDFSRTLSANGDGSDHGWGGHQLVLGGAVHGNRVVGTLPTTALDGADSFKRGDLVPTTSVDQYAATFAKWMGAGSSELDAVVPNIGRFASDDLELFRTQPDPDGGGGTGGNGGGGGTGGSGGGGGGTPQPDGAISDSTDDGGLQPARRIAAPD